MLRDLDMIVHRFPSEINIYAIADVHLGALEHAGTAWEAFLRRIKAEGAYIILNGDLINNSTRGTKFANPFEEALRPREAKRKMVEYLDPIKDHVLCLTGGNHEARTARESDQDITYDIACKLGIEHLYRENVCFMAVSVGTRNTEKKAMATYNFVVTHGSGGGALTGSAVNKAEKFADVIDGMDCLVVAHTHKGFVTRPTKLVMDSRNKQVHERDYLVISCVPWLAYAGYAAKAMLHPAHTCNPQAMRLIADKDHKRIVTTW